MDISFLTVLKIFYIVCSSFLILAAGGNLGFCANPQCSEPVALGTTLNLYYADAPGKLTFSPQQKLDIYVRDYGAKKDLLGVSLNGQKGFVPKSLIREERLICKDLVPAEVKFGHSQVDLNHAASQVIEISSQEAHANPNTDMNTQASMQGYQTQENPYASLGTSGENLQVHTSEQAQVSSSGVNFQPQFDGTSQKKANPEPSNTHQQFSNLMNHQFPPHHSELNSPSYTVSDGDFQQLHSSGMANMAHPPSEINSHLHTGSDFNVQHPSSANMAQLSAELNSPPNTDPDFNTFLHNSFSEMANIAQQHAASSQSHQPYLAHVQPSHSMNVEQVIASNLNPPQQQYGQVGSGNTEDQRHLDSLQTSFSSQSSGHLSDPSFPSSFITGTNGQGREVDNSFMQTDSVMPNKAPDVKQSTGSFFYANNYPPSNTKETVIYSPSSVEHDTQTENTHLYQDTAELLRHRGVDIDDYLEGYLSDTPYNSNPSPDLVHQNKINPSLEPTVGESQGTVDKMPSQSEVLDSLGHTMSLEPSFQSTSTTKLKADFNSHNTVFEAASSTTESKKADISDGVTGLDEENEDDEDVDVDGEEEDEAEVEDEDSILANDENNLKANVSENDLKPEKDTNVQHNEAINYKVSSQSTNSVFPSETQSSNAHDSSAQNIAHTFPDGNTIVSDMSASQNESDKETTTQPPHTPDSIVDNSVEKIKEKSENFNELSTQPTVEIESKDSLLVQTEDESTTDNETPQDTELKEETGVAHNIMEEIFFETEDLPIDSFKEHISGKIANETNDILDEKQADFKQIVNISELSEADKVAYLNSYQIRNLKEDEENKDIESSMYELIENSLEAIRSFIEAFLSWIPEPLYSVLMDLENKGISPRVAVFTALSAVPCILLIIGFVFIKEKSKENALTAQLAVIEKNAFTLSAQKIALEEKLDKTAAEFESLNNMLHDERKTFDSMKPDVEFLKGQLEKANSELENSVDEINTLKEREKEFMELVKDHEKIHLDLTEEKSQLEKKVADQEDYINNLSNQVEERENEISSLQTEVDKFKQCSEDFEGKLTQLQTNCNQLLKEAEVWNTRVNELNAKLSEESSAKEELKNSLMLKEDEVESLTHLVQTFKSYEEIDSSEEEERKSCEEKLKCLLDSSSILIKLQNQEEDNSLLSKKLVEEKNKILEMEVEILEAKSEIDKLKLNYNQALQDKTEATTKLKVLTGYFKEKEITLQKQLGVQEAFRERREKDADSAERQVILIEQENASYKSQVASMKQEMEETERNLKTQIAAHEKKAHENWIAARSAERKLEDMKQEVTQLRQRLTLLEREQENWVNSSRDDIIRPIPKRISGMNDDSSNGPDMNNTLDPRHMFPPPPMMLPPDRPLPPLPPLPPFLPPMEPPFRPQPWHHMPPDPNSDFRMTPPDFMRGRELTPPRGRHSGIVDGDLGPLQSSPLGGEMRESHNSTPHTLPDFHDIPPPPPRPFFPPPGHHPRYPLQPPFRREFAPGQKRTDNQGDNSSTGRGQPIPSSQESWPPHNSRV